MRISLRRHLFALVAAGVLPLAALAAVGLLVLFEQQREAAQRRTLEITRAIATAVDGELEHSRSALQVLAASSSLRRNDLPAFYEAAQRTLAAQPRWYNLIVTDIDGRIVLNAADPLAQPPAQMRDRASFDAVLRTGRPQLSQLIPGRYGKAIALRIPVVQGESIRYVLSAILKPESIAQIVSRQRVEGDSLISVFDSAGQRIARSRDHEKMLGTRGSPSLEKLLSERRDEGIGETSTLEGDVLFTAYTRLPESGWTVVMGIPQADLVSPALRSVVLLGAAIALSLLLGLGAAFVLARRISGSMLDLRHAARELGRGELPPQTESSIEELHEVCAAIHAAAQERSAAEAEREILLRSEREARSEAEAANRAKDQFLAMLGHELRNPLAALGNAASVLRHEGAPPAMVARSREVIERQVRHLARLTDDLLDAARALLGKIELRREPVDLSRVVDVALNTMVSTGRTARHAVTSDLAEAWVDGDAVRLEQVASNLLVNAVKYTPEGGSIRVRVSREDDAAVLRVIDNGVGLSPELAARAFDLFVQGERDLDRSQGGLGVGLTRVRRLAELHGGTASVESAGVGQGSEFIVRIPAIAQPSALPPAAPRVTQVATSRLVLVVEDNDDARETLRALLELMGHRVETARDGATGLEKLRAISPDIALVDVGLPQMDGLELARRARASSGHRVLLVALTGYGSEDDRERALDAGFDDHAAKPIEPATLEALMQRIEEREKIIGVVPQLS